MRLYMNSSENRPDEALSYSPLAISMTPLRTNYLGLHTFNKIQLYKFPEKIESFLWLIESLGLLEKELAKIL